MKTTKLTIVLLTAITLLIAQTGAVFAAPALQEGFITGTVTAVTCTTDDATGAISYLVTVTTDEATGTSQDVSLDQDTAMANGIVTSETVCNSDGTVDGAITGIVVSIDPEIIIPEEEEPKHPVALALSLFFSDVTDYEAIIAAHEDGTGFGLIAQALWMTNSMEVADSATFLAIIEAKKSGDYTAFALEDGSIPQNWGQFKKAMSDGDKKANLGAVMSDKDNNGDGNGNSNGNGNGNGNKDKDKEKKN